MLRMVVHTEASLLAEVLNPPFLSSQVAAMLSSQDLKIIVSALQLSDTLLNKLSDQFSVHFRREGVLHQVQKLTDPDYNISLADSSDSSLNMSWSSNNPRPHTSRSWTIAGSSFVNMFPGKNTIFFIPNRSDSNSLNYLGISAEGRVLSINMPTQFSVVSIAYV